MHPSNPLTHSPAEAAALVGASESYLRSEARAGKVPHLRVGRRAIRFTDEHIQQILGIWSQPVRVQPGRLTSPKARKRAA